MAHKDDGSQVRSMDFQDKYPKKGKIVPAYAAQIANYLAKYPDYYDAQFV